MKILKKIGFLTLILFVWGSVPVLAEGLDAAAPQNQNREELIEVLDFIETPMSDVLRMFAELTGTNIVASREVMNLRVTLFLTNISPRRALKTICKLHNLWFVEREGIIRIMTVEEYRQELTIRYDEKTVVFHLRYASGLAVADLVSNLFGERIAFVGHGGFDDFGHIGMGGGGGGGGGTEREAFVAGHGRGLEGELSARIIEKLEKRAEEGGIELKDILAAIEKEAVVYLGVFPRNNSIIARSIDRRVLDEIAEFISKVDTPTSQVLLEGKILEFTLTDEFRSFFDFEVERFGICGGIGEIDVGRFVPLPAATLVFDFMDEEITARLELFEEEGLVHVVGTPMILSANNAPGEFFIGEEWPLVVGYEHEIREIADQIMETVRPVIELRNIGTRLNIIPSINEDRTVTMRFLAEVDTVRPGRASISFVTREGEVVTLPLDTVDTASVENIIVARDGSTLAIGGLIREIDKDLERRVPILGDIPLLGFFFRRDEIVREKRELVFLITPHIMMVPEEAEAISDEVIRRISDHPYVHPDDGGEEESRVESEESRVKSEESEF